MKTWTEEEVEILRLSYNRVTNDQLQERIPSKTPLAIYKKAYKMGLRKDPEISHMNRSNATNGEKAWNWKGGAYKTKAGYTVVSCPGHHRADPNGRVFEHILVWERETGMEIPDNCCIHHLNGNKQDNRIENLCMMLHKAHTVYHHIGSKRSEETRAKISAKAKARFSDKRNHPSYKEIDITEVQKLIDQGKTITDACKAFGISKNTFYEKRKNYGIE